MTLESNEISGYWFVFQNDQLLILDTGNDVKLPLTSLISDLQPHFSRQHKLGIFNNVTCYCAEVESSLPIPHEMQLISLRKAFVTFGVDWYNAIVKAISIITWDKNHQFCSRCGNVTAQIPGKFERLCSVCGLSFYPRISPSMIVLIKKEDKILMSRSPHFPPGAYGLIAGFVEAGESIEEAVHREVKEEVGIEIKNLRYFGSQSWPFPDSLMIGFTADYAAGEILIDTKELEAADWYRYDNLPGGPSSSVSIARKLIDHFIAEQEHKRTNDGNV
jgi:NAD+ diphosphatase